MGALDDPKPGVQLVEPASLAPLMRPELFEFAVPIFMWLCVRLSERYSSELDGALFTVVPAEYLGAYPAIGVRLPLSQSSRSWEITELLQREADRLIATSSLPDVLSVVCDTKIAWSQHTAELFQPGPSTESPVAPNTRA